MSRLRFHRSPSAPPQSTSTAMGKRFAARTSPSAPGPPTWNEANASVNGTKLSPNVDSTCPTKYRRNAWHRRGPEDDPRQFAARPSDRS